MMMISSTSGFWNSQKHYEQLLYVLRLAFSVGFGGFIYGYYLGVINNFPPYTTWNGVHNSLARQCLRPGGRETVNIWIIFHGFGTLLVFTSVWKNGRESFLEPRCLAELGSLVEPRQLATWPCPLFIVGAFFIITFPECGVCLLGMLDIGFGTGLIFVGSTIYLAEISPTRIRGAMVATFFFQIAAGQIAYYLIGLTALYFNYSFIDDDKKYLEKYWYWMLGTIPVLFMFILMRNKWLPEYSPNCHYALEGKKESPSIEILRKTSPFVDDVVREVEALKLAVLKNLASPTHLRAGIACLVAEHLVSMNMVLYYTPRILVHVLQLDQYSANSNKYLMLATLLIKSVLSAIGTLLCIAFVDRYGRRRLLLLSTFGIITCLSFLTFVLYGLRMVAVTSASDMVLAITSDTCTTVNGGKEGLGLLALGALGLYFIFYSMGIGTIPWIINTEIFPLEVRISYGVIGSTTYWFVKIWTSVFHQMLDEEIAQYNIGNVFVILCLLSCVACYIVYVYALETKGYPIEEVEKYGYYWRRRIHMISNRDKLFLLVEKKYLVCSHHLLRMTNE